MKKKLLNSMRVLLVAAGLCVGADVVYGAPAKELYDFTSDEHQGNFTYTGRGTDYSNGTWSYLVSDAWLNNRFNFADGTSSGSHRNYWQVRTFKTNDKNCTGLNYTQETARPFGFLNMKSGDVFILRNTSAATSKLQSLSTNIKIEGGSETLAANTELEFGQRYVVVTSDATTTVEILGVQYCCITSIEIETTDEETITAPTFSIGYNGAKRTVTITDGFTNSFGYEVVTYYTTDGSTPTTSSSVYSDPLDILEACTIKAVSKAINGTVSSVGSQEVTVGKLPIAAPAVSFSSFVANGDFYSPQYLIANGDNSGVMGTPSPTLSATFNGAVVDISAGTFTPNTKGTLVVTASAEGYNSTSTEFSIMYGLYTCQSTPNFNEIALANLAETLGGTWADNGSARESEWSKTGGVNADLTTNGGESYYKYKLTSGGSVDVGSWFTFSRNRGSSNLRVLAGYGLGETSYVPSMKINNPIEGGVVEYVNGKSTPALTLVTMTAEDEAAGSWSATGLAAAQALRYCKYYAPLPTLSDGDAIHLTFDNAGTTGANDNNWKMDFYGTSGKVANVRADWWDETGSGNTCYTYGYTYSSDGGTTADNTNVWASFQSDMTDADIDLTLSYSGGTLYVIGTMTSGQKVYYVNFAKSGITGDLTYNLYGNNATLSNIVTADASVTTAPAHPTNVAVALGSNGYATYANNVYPLNLTSADAYKAAVSGDKVNFTLFEQSVPASTGMLVKGTASGTVNLPIADASTTVDGNEFQVNVSGGNFTAADHTTYYAMIKNSNPLTFGTFAPGTLAFPANKAYLAVAGSAARLMAVFGDDEATGIDSVKSEEITVKGYYNLAGQRVAAPQKGLYIVNGKKVILK